VAAAATKAGQVPAINGAPVEERQAAPSAGVAKPPPTTKRSSASSTPSPAADGLAWLKSRQPGHYTLQLLGARDRAAVQKFARDQQIASPHAIFERRLDGKPWYSLVVGDYPDRAAAVAARERLPAAIKRPGVWPRTFESIQINFQNQ
jgi:DamX protein